MNFERITPEQAGISSKNIIKLMEDFKKVGTELHSFMLIRHHKVFAECYCKPYNKNSPHIMFSFTKMLTSLAIGFADQEEILSLNDRIVDIFPEYLDGIDVSSNLAECRIENLLTMSCGQEIEIPNLGMANKDWIRAFFKQEFKYKPGTHFMYNTAGTNLLAAILKKKSGCDLIEFLTPRLFDKLDIKNVPCMKLPDGTRMGGAGSRLTTLQMAKIIQFVADGGKLSNEQILNQDYIKRATSKMISNSDSSINSDWACGYGYQFWQCSNKGTFRADGAFGQYGIVVPDKDAILIFTSCETILQKGMDVITEDIIKNLKDEPLNEDKESKAVLDYLIKKASLPCKISQHSEILETSINGKTFNPNEKLSGSFADLIGGAGITSKGSYHLSNPPFSEDEFKSLKFEVNDNEVIIHALIGEKEETIPISLESEFNSFTLCSKTYGAVGSFTGTNIFEFTIRCAEAATGKNFILIFDKNGFLMKRTSTFNNIWALTDIKDDDIYFYKK